MEHYRAETELRHIVVRYKDIVRDQEREVRRIAEFARIRFATALPRERARHDDGELCAVKEPLYDRSLERWRHYRIHLAPVIPVLRPVIERLGYGCD